MKKKAVFLTMFIIILGAQIHAGLDTCINIFPGSAIPSQVITVVMSVTNNGALAVDSVAPDTLVLLGSSGASLVTGPAPATSNIAALSSDYFTWTYAAGAAGNLSFTGYATGYENPSGLTITASFGCPSTYINVLVPTETITETCACTDTVTPSVTETLSPTATSTLAGATQTFTRTATAAATPSSTPVVPTGTNTGTPTVTITSMGTAVSTATYTNTVTATEAVSATPSRTATPTFTDTNTMTVTPTVTLVTGSPTFTQTDTESYTATMTSTTNLSTATFTVTSTFTPTRTPTDTVTETITQSYTMTMTDTPLAGTPTSTETNMETGTATITITVAITETWTPTLLVTQTPTPPVTQTPTETVTYTSTPCCTGTVVETGGRDVRVFSNVINPDTGGRVRVVYNIPASGHVRIKVFNRNGACVKTILDDNVDPANGAQGEISWDGKTAAGLGVSSGTYTIAIETDTYTERVKVAVIR